MAKKLTNLLLMFTNVLYLPSVSYIVPGGAGVMVW